MVVITKYQDRHLNYWLKVEDGDAVMLDTKFKCKEDLHSVADDLSWMFTERFNKEVEIVNEL